MTEEGLTTTNVVTITGWVVTFSLGLFSALAIQRRARARKVLKWTLVNQSDLLARDVLTDLESGFGLPVKVLVSGNEETELSTVRVKLANAGNVELQNLTLSFRCGSSASVYVGRYIGNLGLYREKLKLSKQENTATLQIAHINPQQSFELEFLIGKYRADEFEVDMAEPGVTLKRHSVEEVSEGAIVFGRRLELLTVIGVMLLVFQLANATPTLVTYIVYLSERFVR